MAIDVSNSGTKNMLKRSRIFFFATAASFIFISPVIWFVMDADQYLKNASAATSTVVRSEAVAPGSFKVAHAANQTTTKILEMDRAKHRAFWTSVLKNKKLACDVVVRSTYQGSESGFDNWSVSCQDGHRYSMNISPDAQAPACTRNTFAGISE
ncbi:hypothetical protein [Bradyrhizobium australiense]|uniref:Uncharacterized protein n=1 Tax=Bradyrhizobium australiense TaxID=2721161 RepID=A0A7Y4GSR7_9BRAD|nr:hypothetical protein [Bradyrhizobium australiense]NOJ41315.1 hypothetical protein [Bradyrhizobium australiense]